MIGAAPVGLALSAGWLGDRATMFWGPVAGIAVGALSLGGSRGNVAAGWSAAAVAALCLVLDTGTDGGWFHVIHMDEEATRAEMLHAVDRHTAEDAVIVSGRWGEAAVLMLHTGRATTVDEVKTTRWRHAVAHAAQRAETDGQAWYAARLLVARGAGALLAAGAGAEPGPAELEEAMERLRDPHGKGAQSLARAGGPCATKAECAAWLTPDPGRELVLLAHEEVTGTGTTVGDRVAVPGYRSAWLEPLWRKGSTSLWRLAESAPEGNARERR